MSSKLAITRFDPGYSAVLKPWYSPKLKKDEFLGPIFYHEALGILVARYNVLELYFRWLVGRSVGIEISPAEVLLTHVGSVTLQDALLTAAAELITTLEVSEEIEYCVKLFDICRQNRNFLAHNAHEVLPSLGPPRMAITKRSAKGKIRIERYVVELQAIRQAADELTIAVTYLASVLNSGCLYRQLPNTLRLPDRPPLPESLAKSHPKDGMFEIQQKQRLFGTP